MRDAPAAELAMTRRDRAELDARYDRILREDGAALRRVAGIYEGDRARRDDLFQEICLAIWQALPRFRGESSERTFVFRIAHNRGLTHRARRPSAAEGLEAAAVVVDPRPDPEAGAGEAERRGRLRQAVLALPLEPRQVLTLTLEGLAPREIADILGISENNVAVRLTRARQALRRSLENQGEIA